MAEIMFVHMPAALLLGALAGWLACRRMPQRVREMVGVAALVLASIAMPFWMLPVMMDRAAAFPSYGLARDVSLALTGAAIVVGLPAWSPVIRHLWVLEQVAMLVRYAIWYGFSAVALCTAWDAGAQQAVGRGLLVLTVFAAGAYLLLWWRASRAGRWAPVAQLINTTSNARSANHTAATAAMASEPPTSTTRR